jgi:hypothetical protein
MPELADIVRRYGPGYLQAFGDTILPSHRQALRDIVRCRTPALGGEVYRCNHCAQFHYAYHSCANRHCPKCRTAHSRTWLQKRQHEMLPVPYFHVIFTLPAELRPIVRSHQKALYSILMQAGARSLIKLAADPRYVGGRIGVLAALHTWGRDLSYHPHLHCLVPAGGVGDDDCWIAAPDNFLVPVRALTKIFRGMFMELTGKALPEVQLPPSVWEQDWAVYCKPVPQGPHNVLNYLARYVHRVAITNQRIVSIDDGKVTFRYQRSGETAWRTMTLGAHEFLRRFLQHVVPPRTHKVRYYGLWAPANRDLLHRVQAALLSHSPQPPIAPSLAPPFPPASGWAGQRCPYCRRGILVWFASLPREPRAPP